MKQRVLFLFISLFTCSLVAQKNVQIISTEISFVFLSKDVKGTLSGFSSDSVIDLDDLTNSRFKGSVDAKTIDTGNFIRNWALRGGKYFNVADHPRIKFESTSVSENENGFLVDGQLTIKGISKPVTFDFEKKENTIIGTTTLNSTDFDIVIVKKHRKKNQVKVKLIFGFK